MHSKAGSLSKTLNFARLYSLEWVTPALDRELSMSRVSNIVRATVKYEIIESIVVMLGAFKAHVPCLHHSCDL